MLRTATVGTRHQVEAKNTRVKQINDYFKLKCLVCLFEQATNHKTMSSLPEGFRSTASLAHIHVKVELAGCLRKITYWGEGLRVERQYKVISHLLLSTWCSAHAFSTGVIHDLRPAVSRSFAGSKS